MALKPIEILINAKDQASGVFDKLGNKLKVIGAAVAGYFGVKAFAGVVDGAADFEEAMSKVQAATKASSEEMAKLQAAAKNAGANSKFTAVEAANALENLAKAGLSSAEAIATLTPVMSMAQADGIGLAAASERLTGVVMGMGLSFSESARVADVLAAGSAAARTSIAGLADGLSYAAPIAKSVGLSLESTVAIMAQFSNAGIDASRAGTALNSILSQFSDPASKFRTELTALGINTGNFDLALKQLAATGGSGAAAILAVGTEAGPALRAALNLGIPALEKLRGELYGAEGEAAAMAKTMGNNLNGAVKGLSSAWEAAKIVLGTPVLPVLKDGVDKLSGAFRAAVSDGTVGKFGEAIATAFQSGITWAKAFIAEINFNKLTTDLQDFATRTGAAFAQVGAHATNAGNIVKLIYGVMSSGSNFVLGAVYGIGAAFAGVASNIESGLALIFDGFAKVTPGKISESYKLAADEIRLSANATMAASEALAAKSLAAFAGVADGAQLARDGYKGLAKEAVSAQDAAAASAANAAEKIAQVNAAVAVMRTEYAELIAKGDLEAAAAKTREIDAALASLSTTLPTATAEQKKKSDADAQSALAAEQHRAAIATLRTEYAELVASGDWQGAVEKQQEINKAMRESGPASKDAVKAAEELSGAYTNLGVTSSQSLTNFAKKARDDYELIKNSATASAADISAAFAAAAEKSIAANNGLAPSWVKAEAAARGYKIEMDAAGKETLKLVNASQTGAQALKTLGIDAEAVSTKMSSGFKESADAVTALQNNFSALGAQGVKASEAITLGLNKMLSEAKNQADLDALRTKVEGLRGVLGNTVANGFLEQAAKKADELKAAMDAATPGINSAAEAFKTLGITSDKELKQTAATAKEAFDAIKASGTASPREISEAWKAMAEASIAANNGVADAAITSGAAAQGFAIEVDAAGKASVKSLTDVKEGFEKIDYAAQMAGKSAKELTAAMNDWHGGKNMADSAAMANAAANELANSWQSAAVEADKYYGELYDIFIKHQQLGAAPDPWAFSKSIFAASAALQELDKQQQKVQRSSNDASGGLANLQDRLLELSGSEEDVAAQRKQRDRAEIDQKIALLQLDVQRAQIRKNDEEAAQLEKEIASYRQQLILIEQIAAKEKQNRDTKRREEEQAAKERKKQEEDDAKDRKAQQDKADQDRKLQQQKADGSSSGGKAYIADESAAQKDADTQRRARQDADDKARQDALRKQREDEDKALRKQREDEDKALHKQRQDQDKADKARYDAERKAIENADKARQEARQREADALAKAHKEQDDRAQRTEQERKAREAADRTAQAAAQTAAEAQRAEREAVQSGKRGASEQAALDRQRDAVLAAQKAQAQEQDRLEQERAEAASAASAKRLQAQQDAQTGDLANRDKAAQETQQARLQELADAEQARQEALREQRERDDELAAQQREREDAAIAERRERDDAMIAALRDVVATLLATSNSPRPSAAGTASTVGAVLEPQAPKQQGIGGGGGNGGIGVSAGSSNISNIFLSGAARPVQVRFADQSSQKATEQLLRQLASAKGAAQ